MMRRRPNLPTARKVDQGTTNIYAAMVTRNLAQQTYTVDENGMSVAITKGSRNTGGPILRAETPTLSFPPEKGMLDRTQPLD